VRVEAAPARTPGAAGALRIQITSERSGGVRDHARCLHEAWTARGQPCQLWTLGRPQPGVPTLATRLRQAQAAAGAGRLELLLHVSVYEYGNRGLCGWLAEAVHAARHELGASLHLVLMFHELFASGPPWRSAFWLGPVQAAVLRRLARLADGVATNTAHHAAWLVRQGLQTQQPLALMPVFSSLGEPEARQLAPLAQRRRQCVLLGTEGTRQRAVQALQHRAQARQALQALGALELLEIGPGASVAPRQPLFQGAWRSLGLCSQPELSQCLAESAFGLIEYPDLHLAKSSVLAAYAAHACAVLNLGRGTRAADGLQPGVHYLAASVPCAPGGGPAAQAVAQALHRWYGQHPLGRQERVFSGLLSGDGAPA